MLGKVTGTEDYMGERDPGILELLIVHADEFEKIGATGENGESFKCCRAELVNKVKGCNQVGTLILPFADVADSKSFGVVSVEASLTDGSEAVRIFDAPTVANNTGKLSTLVPNPTEDSLKKPYFYRAYRHALDEQFKIVGQFNTLKTGNHFVVLSNCNDKRVLSRKVMASGWLVAMNPYGYLPAELYGFLPFYEAMSIFYIALLIIWSIALYRFQDSLLDLQKYITIVLVLSAIEMVCFITLIFFVVVCLVPGLYQF